MSTLDLGELRALLEAATPGPWEARIEGSWPWVALYDDEDKIDGDESLPSFEPGGTATHADAVLIAAAVNALPALLDDLEAAREQIAEAEIRGQMKHITAEMVRGDQPLEAKEELIAELRARVSHLEAARADTERATTITNTKAALDYLDTMRAEIETLTAQRDRAERRHERLESGVEAMCANPSIRRWIDNSELVDVSDLRALLAESAASEEGA